MSLIVLGSVRGAPGVTTAALALVGWLRGSLLVEADGAGGVLALRYGLGREPGLLTLAADRQADDTSFLVHAQRLPGGVPVLVGPETPEQVAFLWRRAGVHLLKALRAAEGPVLVDAGRLGPSDRVDGLVAAADLVLLVVHCRVEELVAAGHRMHALAELAPVGLVLVGEGPYRPADITAQLGGEILAALPEDRRAAASLEAGGDSRALRRSPLARAARGLAEALTDRLEMVAAGGEPGLGVTR